MKDFFILEYVDSQMKNSELALKDARMLYKKIVSMTNLGLCSIEFKNDHVTGIKEFKSSQSQLTLQENQPIIGYLVANFWRSKKSW